MPFHNAPETNIYEVAKQINGKTVVFEFKTENHHVYNELLFENNKALQAMQAEGLFHGNDFRVNGVQLASELRVKSIDGVEPSNGSQNFKNINKFEFAEGNQIFRGENIVPGSFHRGGHPEYSKIPQAHADALLRAYDEGKANGWGDYANEREWLKAQSKEMFGFSTELKALLKHPEIESPVNKPAATQGVSPTQGMASMAGQQAGTDDTQIWVVEVIAPFGGAEEIVKDLKAKVFPQREVRYLVTGPQGKQVKVI